MNTHILMSVFVTNQSLGFDYRLSGDQKNLRINQLISTLHSMSLLETQTQTFYIEYDSDNMIYKQSVSRFIIDTFPNSIIYDFRLEKFSQWQDTLKSIPGESDMIFLQGNADHVYTQDNSEAFKTFAQEVRDLDQRVIGCITHWPEAVFNVMNPLNTIKTSKKGNFISETRSTIGTCLVTPELYQEWWLKDFTEGLRIIRPDNVFGPSVSFPSAKMLTPNQEMFRHLDGYGHVGITDSFSSYLRPCCTIMNEIIVHDDWKRTRIRNWENNSDLPLNQLVIDSGFCDILDYLTWASSYRSNFSIVKIVKESFKVNTFLLITAYIYYLVRHPKKFGYVIIDEVFIRFGLTLFVSIVTFGKDQEAKKEFNFRVSQFTEMIYLRGLVFSLKSRIKPKVGKASK
jgi:hypothetical protein